MTSPTIRKAVTRMAKTRMDKKYTGEVMKQAQQMSREDYKAVKHMDKVQMIAYLQRIYRRGYEAGVKPEATPQKAEQAAAEAVVEE